MVELVGVAAKRSMGVVVAGPARAGLSVCGAGIVGSDGVVVLLLSEWKDTRREDISGGASAGCGMDKVGVKSGA